MLDTIPYIFFFALRADGKSVFLCIYRPGCFRTVRRRSEGNWQESWLLHFKTFSCDPEIRGERGEFEEEKAVSS